MDTLENASLIPDRCSNIKTTSARKTSQCREQAIWACPDCGLVQYCGIECQIAHWGLHRSDCKSDLMKSDWKPAYDRKRRTPFPISEGVPQSTPFGTRKYLWGNVPAVDILNLEENEGLDSDKNHALLFAASGDIRNVVKSISGLPPTPTTKCSVSINDWDFDIVARNAILLLVAFNYEPNLAAPMMIHLWYSALIPSHMYDKLQKDILPLVTDVCNEIEDKPLSSYQSKIWTFGNGSLRLVLRAKQWFEMRQFFEIPTDLTATHALEIRRDIMLAPSRIDYLERALFNQPPAWRICTMKFREVGVLLPYGSCHEDFDTPNPTFFQTNYTWPFMDSSDLLSGWNIDDIINNAPVARNDKYGGLVALLQRTLIRFCRNLRNFNMKIQLFHENASRLSQLLQANERFDRIEVSNIMDRGYLGPGITLKTLGPLLRSKAENRHAAIVALFMNATHTQEWRVDPHADIIPRVQTYLPLPNLDEVIKRRAEMQRFVTGALLFKDNEGLFERFGSPCDLENISRENGLRMRRQQMIVTPWPLRLRHGATQAEFDVLLASGHVGSERYVEWERI